MKKINKVFSLVLLFTFFLLLHLSMIKVNGDTSIIMSEGARIRVEGIQGLKFEATFSDSLRDCERGFFLIYGEASLDDLLRAIEDGSMVLNNEKIFKATTNYNSDINTISVVLTGIPVSGYASEITVFGYAYADGNYTFVLSGITRSVAEVAFRAGNNNDQQVEKVLTDIRDNFFSMYYTKNKFEIASVYENNNEYLKTEFIRDWNQYMNTSWNELNATAFFDFASINASDISLKESNLYIFFHNQHLMTKWSWLLKYLKAVGNDIITVQIEALESDGINDSFNLNKGEQLSYSICNFFNGDNKVGQLGYAIDFYNNSNYYDTVSNYNHSIYISQKKYQLIKVHDEIILTNINKLGYRLYYQTGELLYPAGDKYILMR